VLQREHAAHSRAFLGQAARRGKGKRMIGKLAGVAGSLCCCAMLAGCGGAAPSAPSSPGGTSSPASSGGAAGPAWASALGTGVTVIPPAPAAPGNSSPAAVVQGIVTANVTNQLSSICAYVEPSFEAQCSQDAASALASQVASVKNFAIGYVVIDGTQALVGTTGTSCAANMTPECETNTNPAAIFDTGQSFQTLWTEANANVSSNSSPAAAYTLYPCTEINGQWYLDTQGV
jgi:hypothetical protein